MMRQVRMQLEIILVCVFFFFFFFFFLFFCFFEPLEKKNGTLSVHIRTEK